MNRRQSVLCDELMKPCCDYVRPNRCAVPCGEQPVAVLPLVTHPQVLLRLLGSPCFEHGHNVRRHFHAAFRSCILCFVLKYALARQIKRRAPHGDNRPLEINVFPFQSAEFTTAHTCEQQQLHDHLMLHTFLIQRRKQVCRLFLVQIDGFLAI